MITEGSTIAVFFLSDFGGGFVEVAAGRPLAAAGKPGIAALGLVASPGNVVPVLGLVSGSSTRAAATAAAEALEELLAEKTRKQPQINHKGTHTNLL